MTRKPTGLEPSVELSRRIHRWPALRNEPGDEKVYELARAVRKLQEDVLGNTVEIEVGLNDLAPLIREIRETKGGGGLFAEGRELASQLEALQGK